MNYWPHRHPLPPFGRRYGHADGALMLAVPTVRTLLDVLEVDLSPYRISEQGGRLVLDRGRHACMLTISAPTQPDNEAPPALVHMSVSRGRAGVGAAPPDPAVAREFERLLLNCWPGVTEHDRWIQPHQRGDGDVGVIVGRTYIAQAERGTVEKVGG